MDYLKEFSGVDNNTPKSILTIENKEQEIIIDNTIIEIYEKRDFIEIDLFFKDTPLSKIWDTYELFQKNDIKLLLLPIKHKGNLYMKTKEPFFWTLTSSDLTLGLNLIKLLFYIDDCTIFTNMEILDG